MDTFSKKEFKDVTSLNYINIACIKSTFYCKKGRHTLITPVQWAAETGELEVMERLLENGSEINPYMILSAAYYGHLNIVKRLVPSFDSEWIDYAVQYAAQKGHLEMIKFLVRHGADITANDHWAIKWAVNNEHHHVVNYLAQLDTDSMDIINDQVISKACKGDSLIIKCLVKVKSN